MYSDKENVNILTALLVAHGVKHAVVCPGSRNAPIVHNLNECDGITCLPTTDERSAGFYALGLALQSGRPVVVCVTSGSALLNVAPAVAEAFYRHAPLIVVSADRPAAWIGQLDGQTLPQTNAFGPLVRKAVTLPEPADDTERWHCNRLANEALALSTFPTGAPVHINVPISEPLFNFTTPQLPMERTVKIHSANTNGGDGANALLRAMTGAMRPMVVVGQCANDCIGTALTARLARHITVLAEPLGCGNMLAPFDTMLHNIGADEEYMPDFVVYIGDTIVSKRLRRFLRMAKAQTFCLTPDATQLADPLMSLTDIVECRGEATVGRVLEHIANQYEACMGETADGMVANKASHAAFRELWRQGLANTVSRTEDFEPPYSQMAAVKYFEEQLEDIDYGYHIHYANSSAVRLANIYADHYVWCNRGVNGIEGSLSTAAGFSLATDDMVFCVIGDLSFFYDQNALWNVNLRGNLRILLLNNGEGGIFSQLKGLSESAAAHDCIAAAHGCNAQGICTQNDIGYIKATNMAEMQMGIVTLITRESQRPMLLEVATSADDDTKALKDYFG